MTTVAAHDWAMEFLASDDGRGAHAKLRRDGVPAIKALESQLMIEPFNGPAWLLLGLAKRELECPKLARDDLRQAEALEGLTATLAAEIARTHLDEGDASSAEKVVARFVDGFWGRVGSVKRLELLGFLDALEVRLETLLCAEPPNLKRANEELTRLSAFMVKVSDTQARRAIEDTLVRGLCMAAVVVFPEKLDPALLASISPDLRRWLELDGHLSILRQASIQELGWPDLEPLTKDATLSNLLGSLLYRRARDLPSGDRWQSASRLLQASDWHPQVRLLAVKILDDWARSEIAEARSESAVGLWELAAEIEPTNPEIPRSLGIIGGKLKDEIIYQRSWHRTTYLMECHASLSGEPALLKTALSLRSTFFTELGNARKQHKLTDVEDILCWARLGFLSCLDRQLTLSSVSARLLQPPRASSDDVEVAEAAWGRACQAVDGIPGTMGSSIRLSLLNVAARELQDVARRKLASGLPDRRELEAMRGCRNAWAELAVQLYGACCDFFKGASSARNVDDYVEIARLLLAIPSQLIEREILRLADPDGTGELRNVRRLFRRNCTAVLLRLTQELREPGHEDARRRCLEAAAGLCPDDPYLTQMCVIDFVEKDEDFAAANDLLEDSLASTESDLEPEERQRLESLQRQVRQGLLQKLMSPAIGLMKEQKWGAALKTLGEALQRFPNSAIVLYHAALCALKDGDLEGGKKYIARARGGEDAEPLAKRIDELAKNPELVAVEKYLIAGHDALEKERFDEARRQLEQATQVAPQFAQAWYLLAVAHARLEQYDEADDAIMKAILRGSEKEKDVYRKVSKQLTEQRLHAPLQGVIPHMNRKDWAGALSALEGVCTRHPKNHLAWFYRAVCELRLRMTESAGKSIANAIKQRDYVPPKKPGYLELLKPMHVDHEYEQLQRTIQRKLARGVHGEAIDKAEEAAADDKFEHAWSLLRNIPESALDDESKFLLAVACFRFVADELKDGPLSDRETARRVLSAAEDGRRAAEQLRWSLEFGTQVASIGTQLDTVYKALVGKV